MNSYNHSKASEDLATIRRMMEAANSSIYLSAPWFCFSGIIWLLIGTSQILLGLLRNYFWISTAEEHIIFELLQVSVGINCVGTLLVCMLYIQNRIKSQINRMGLQIMDIWFVTLVVIPVLFRFLCKIPFGPQERRIVGLAIARQVIIVFTMYITSISLKNKGLLLFCSIFMVIAFAAQIFPITFIAEIDGIGQSIFCLSDEILIEVLPGVFLVLLGLSPKKKHNV